jgi:hypothetical protein
MGTRKYSAITDVEQFLGWLDRKIGCEGHMGLKIKSPSIINMILKMAVTVKNTLHRKVFFFPLWWWVPLTK